MLVVGVDGCRGGWLSVAKDLNSGAVNACISDRLGVLVKSLSSPFLVAVDMPIGLPDVGPRECDLEARKRLGKPRSSSVFPAPVRAVLEANSFEEAGKIARAADGRGLMQQVWRIVPKIREVDQLLRGDRSLPASVREVHPEVSFSIWNGGVALVFGKKSRLGRAERQALVLGQYGSSLAVAESGLPPGAFAADDLLDAFACLWTAERIVSGEALVLPFPSGRAVDTCGLRMEICA